MNRYDEYYDFRLATIDDVEDIMAFIRAEWNPQHIMGNDRELFLWQHGRTEYGDSINLNIILMTEKDGKIMGMNGFIVYSNDLDNLHISPTMSKVRAKGVIPMAGVELMKRMVTMTGAKVNLTAGAEPKTLIPIYEKIYRYEVGIMDQYYMLNPYKEEFKIAKISKMPKVKVKRTECRLEEINDILELDSEYDFSRKYKRITYKSKEFIDKRYFKHPIYTYKKWMVRGENKDVVGILFGREAMVDGDAVLRLVDYIGELRYLGLIGYELQQMMIENEWEYVDLVVSPLPDDIMKDSGFSLLDLGGENIIPNYFEPFVQKNIYNHYHNNSDEIIFKAHGDQDRPSVRV